MFVFTPYGFRPPQNCCRVTSHYFEKVLWPRSWFCVCIPSRQPGEVGRTKNADLILTYKLGPALTNTRKDCVKKLFLTRDGRTSSKESTRVEVYRGQIGFDDYRRLWIANVTDISVRINALREQFIQKWMWKRQALSCSCLTCACGDVLNQTEVISSIRTVLQCSTATNEFHTACAASLWTTRHRSHERVWIFSSLACG